MSINEFTKYRVANLWVNNQFDKNKFEFVNKGNFAYGKLTWSNAKKEQGKQVYTNSKMDFICFGETINLIESNLGSSFTIDAKLLQEKYTDKEGKDRYLFKLILNKAELVNDDLKPVDKHNQSKANGYQPEPDNEDNFGDNIPF